MTERKCGLIARWWHARKRSIDREMVGNALIVACGSDTRRLQETWHMFRHDQGQEHWQCPCAPQGEEAQLP